MMIKMKNLFPPLSRWLPGWPQDLRVIKPCLGWRLSGIALRLIGLLFRSVLGRNLIFLMSRCSATKFFSCRLISQENFFEKLIVESGSKTHLGNCETRNVTPSLSSPVTFRWRNETSFRGLAQFQHHFHHLSDTKSLGLFLRLRLSGSFSAPFDPCRWVFNCAPDWQMKRQNSTCFIAIKDTLALPTLSHIHTHLTHFRWKLAELPCNCFKPFLATLQIKRNFILRETIKEQIFFIEYECNTYGRYVTYLYI